MSKLNIPLKYLKDANGFEKHLRSELEKAVIKDIKSERERIWNSLMNGDGKGIEVKGLEGYL